MIRPETVLTAARTWQGISGSGARTGRIVIRTAGARIQLGLQPGHCECCVGVVGHPLVTVFVRLSGGVEMMKRYMTIRVFAAAIRDGEPRRIL